MKRLISLVLTALMLCSLTVPALAAEITDGSEVTAKYTAIHEGEYRGDVTDGEATAGGISVTGAPDNAAVLVIVPMKGEALDWVDRCVDGVAAAAYDIHFLTADGLRIEADGVTVSIPVSGTDPRLSAVTTSGGDRTLPATVSGGSVTFTAADGPYFVVTGAVVIEDVPTPEPEPDTPAPDEQPVTPAPTPDEQPVAPAPAPGGEEPAPGDTVTVPVRGDESELHADVTLGETHVDLHDLSFAEIDHIVGDHVNTGVVEVDLTGLGEDVSQIILPVPTVEHIVQAAEVAHNDTEALQIDFPHGSVKLNDKTLRAVVEQAECNEVLLVLEKVGDVRLNDTQKEAVAELNIYGGYEAYMVCVKANKRISDFNGGLATLSVPFEVPDGMDADRFSVWYIADDGSAEKLDTRYEDGHLVWDVGHFSDFVIVYEDEGAAEPDAPETPETPDTPVTPDGSRSDGDGCCWCWLILLLLVIVLIILLLWKRRKKDDAEQV